MSIAEDEAHCIQVWLEKWHLCSYVHAICASISAVLYRGETFHKAFQHIGGLCALTKAPFMALTASAPPEIETEINLSLSLTPLLFSILSTVQICTSALTRSPAV